MEPKKWYTSKTLWVNALALISSLSLAFFGYVISPEIQVGALTVLNFLLRAITKEEIIW